MKLRIGPLSLEIEDQIWTSPGADLEFSLESDPPDPPDPPDPADDTPRLGWNLDFVYSPAAWTYADKIHGSRPWLSTNGFAGWDDGRVIPVDAAGYPTTLAAGQHAVTLVPTHNLSDRFVIKWTGAGRITVSDVGAVETNTQGLIVVRGNPALDRMQLRVTSLPVSALSIRREADLNDQRAFDPTFLRGLESAKCIRTMQPGLANGDPTNVPNPESEWSSRHSGATLFQSPKMSWEWQISLCNEALCDLWVCIPHRATDDYAKQLGAMVQSRLEEPLKVYVELSNEIWNGSFGQHAYAKQQGLGQGLSTDPNAAQLRWSGKRSVEIWKAFMQGWGPAPGVVRVIGAQCPDRVGKDDGSSEWAIDQLMSLVPAGECDALAVAPYFGGGEGWPFYTSATVDQILTRLQDVSVPRTIVDMKVAKRMANKYGVALLGYEGGQHIASPDPGATPQALVQKLIAVNRDPRMYQIYWDWLNGWEGAGGGLLCHYTFTGPYSHFGFWGALERSDQAPSTAHKYRAMLEWAKET